VRGKISIASADDAGTRPILEFQLKSFLLSWLVAVLLCLTIPMFAKDVILLLRCLFDAAKFMVCSNMFSTCSCNLSGERIEVLLITSHTLDDCAL